MNQRNAKLDREQVFVHNCTHNHLDMLYKLDYHQFNIYHQYNK